MNVAPTRQLLQARRRSRCPHTENIQPDRRDQTGLPPLWPGTSLRRPSTAWAQPGSCLRELSPRADSTSTTRSSGTCIWAIEPSAARLRGCSPPVITTWRPSTAPSRLRRSSWPAWTSPANGPAGLPVGVLLPVRQCGGAVPGRQRCDLRDPANPGIPVGRRMLGASAPSRRTAPTRTSTSSCASSTTAPTPPRIGDASDGGVRGAWAALFDEYQVDLVLQGHNHVSNAPTRSAAGSRPRRPRLLHRLPGHRRHRLLHRRVRRAGPATNSSRAAKATAATRFPILRCRTATSGTPTARNRRSRRLVPGAVSRDYAFIRVDVRPGHLLSEMDVTAVDEYGREFDKVTYRRQVRAQS